MIVWFNIAARDINININGVFDFYYMKELHLPRQRIR